MPAGAQGGVPPAPHIPPRPRPLPTRHNVCVTLNRDDEIRPERVLARMRYDHPVFDRAAVAAVQGGATRIALPVARGRAWRLAPRPGAPGSL